MFLAAIMVLSVVAMTAFTGGVAATAPDTSLQDSGNNAADQFDALSNTIRYEGQTYNITFNVSDHDDDQPRITFNQTWGGQDEVYLAEVTDTNDNDNPNSFGDVTPLSNESAASSDDIEVELDLEGVESGTYVISNSSAVGGSTGYSDQFTVAEQGLSADFTDDSATELDNTTVELTSNNRPSLEDQNVTVSVDGPDDFDAEMIETVFNVSNGTVDPANTLEENRTAGGTVVASDHLPLDYLGYDRDDGDNINDIRDDDYVTLNLNNLTSRDTKVSNGLFDTGNDELEVDFTRFEQSGTPNAPDDGEYEFEFIATDTGATATTTIDFSESDEGASFSEGTSQTPAGDLAEFEMELEDTDDTFVQIGGEDSDFVDVLYIQAEDEDEPVNVEINTRLLGIGNDSNNGNVDAVYNTENVETIESEMHSTGGISSDNIPGGLNALYEDDGSGPGNDFAQYVRDIGITDAGESRHDQLTRPVQPTDYEVVAAGTNGEDYAFDADPGGVANNELGSKVIELQTPEIGEITTHTAPEESADDETEVDALVEAATPRDEVALDDRLVVQVEATGIYGALVANGTDSEGTSDYDRLEDGISTGTMYNVLENTNESINFEVVAESTTGNQDPLEIALDDTGNNGNSDSYIVLDEENGQFFLIADTSSDNAFANGEAPDEATSFTAELEYDADNGDDRYEFQDAGANGPNAFYSTSSSTNYPYLLQGETLSNTADVDLTPATFDFDNVNEDDQVQAENVEDAEVSGETNVAPGSDAEIRASSTDASSSFRLGNDVNISSDGSVTTTYDLSGQEVGDEFGIDFRVGGSSTDTADGVIVEAVSEEPADDGEETNETDEPADDGEEEPADDGEEDDGEEDDSTDDGTPGFGAVVALIALIGAALLAVRRQN